MVGAPLSCEQFKFNLANKSGYGIMLGRGEKRYLGGSMILSNWFDSSLCHRIRVEFNLLVFVAYRECISIDRIGDFKSLGVGLSLATPG